MPTGRTPKERSSREKEISEYHREYRQRNAEVLREKKRAYERRVKDEGIAAYGGQCACCGETEVDFLTIDHIAGREQGDRFTGKKAWMKLKALGWPTENIQILCWNCNCAKYFFGGCPHQRSK